MLFYFGYASNMNSHSLEAKGVRPRSTEKAKLLDYALTYDVKHWFPHEGGVANVVQRPGSEVQGALHELDDSDLEKLDQVESYGVGYDRIEVEVQLVRGKVRALTYVGIPDYLDEACLPTARYMNIIVTGARQLGLDEQYVEKLTQQRIFEPPTYGPFEPPEGNEFAFFDDSTLSTKTHLTALAGHVFDMSGAPDRLRHLEALFGGKDMTLFIVRRHDTSSGRETWEDVLAGNIPSGARAYLDAYLHNFGIVFRYAGRMRYR